MDLLKKIKTRKAKIGVIGLGYVGLPLIEEFVDVGFSVVGFDTDTKKVASLMKGKSYIKHIPEATIKKWLSSKRFLATSSFTRLAKMDAVIICVPTPLDEYRYPDLSYICCAATQIAKRLKKGQLVVLESTTYPGTTEEELKSVFEKSGFKVGKDFYLGFSPERQDPNNKDFTTKNVPKIVSGCTKKCLTIVKALYDTIIERTVPVSSTQVAEAAKLLENIYRAVNIALVNELKMLFSSMGVDIWEVIDAAKTKPFGFNAFYPGPGFGGHCIPVDPFYLTWKARKYDISTHFIEFAGEVNAQMPHYITEKLFEVMNKHSGLCRGNNVLMLGIAYKRDIDDVRESPAFRIIQLLQHYGMKVSYHDPYVPVCHGEYHYTDVNLRSVPLTKETIEKADAVILITDHSCFDYVFIEKHAKCILDTRNAFGWNGIKSEKIIKC